MATKFVDDSKGHFRFSDVPDEPRRRLPPVQGFEEKPTVTLEKAVAPLESLVPQVQHMVWTVKDDSSEPMQGLTIDESASIKLYTLQWSSKEKSFYHILNVTLRSIDREKLKPWFLYLKLVVSAFSNLPCSAEKTILFRGVKMDLRQQYPEGSTFVWWGFSSCTLAMNVLEREAFCGKSGPRTLFNIECYSGKNIQHHSFYPDEVEILLLPGRQFKVVGRGDMGNDLHILHIKETEPPFPLISIIPPRPPIPIKKPLIESKKLVTTPPQPPSASKVVAPKPKPPLELSYSSKNLNDADMQRVINEALIQQQCTKLDLSFNNFAHEGAAHLAQVLKKNQVSKITAS